MSKRRNASAAALLCAAFWAGGAAAQETAGADPVGIYQREAFQYDRGGRPDPFRSLLGTPEMGVRVEDLTLRGVIYNPDPRRSVAVVMDGSTERRVRLRVGERLGGITVVGIYPRRIDVRVDEFGVARPETLYLKTRTEQEPDSAKGSAS